MTINEPDSLSVTTDSINHVSCNGDTNGAIYISVNGGTPGYSFSWTGPGTFTSTNQDITNLSAGDYNLVVKDANGCTKDYGPVTITEPLVLTSVTDSINHISCFGADNGSIYISANGGTMPYSYSWTGPNLYTSTNEDITDLEPGDYSLVVTDAKGCSNTLGPVTITEPELLVAALDSVKHIRCNGMNDGAIYISVTGGTSPYSYAWTDTGSFTSTDQNITDLFAGEYSLMVTDTHGCTDSLLAISVTEPAPISASIDTTSKTHLSCNGDTDGNIDITVTGGIQPYTYSWTGPNGFTSSDKNISGLEAGDFNLTITDSNLCVQVYTPLTTITEPPELQMSLEKSDIQCSGENNGSIIVHASGGTSPYEYSRTGSLWQTDSIFSGLPPGGYLIFVRDTNLCQTYDTVLIIEPPALTIQSEIKVDSGIICFGDNKGIIEINAVGGTPPLEYSIDSGYTFSSTNRFTDLPAGEYQTVVKDTNGCLVYGNLNVITQPKPLKITYYSQDDIISCFGATEGRIVIQAEGGKGQKQYILDSTRTSSFGIFDNVTGGPHLIQILDEKGCIKDTNVVLNQPPEIIFDSISITSVTGCYGDSNGALFVSSSGGTGSLQYSFEGGAFQDTSSWQNLTGGDYLITVMDENNCQVDTLITVPQPDTISVFSINVQPVTCEGDTNGIVTIVGAGGTPPYTYTLNPGSSSNSTGVFTSLPPGKYTIEIGDANGCPTYTTDSVSVDEPPPLLIDSVRFEEITCYGTNDGQITIYAHGGYFPLNYSIDNGLTFDTIPVFPALTPSTYYTFVEDSNGCSVIGDTVILSEPPEISIDSQTSTDVSTCFGDSTGSISILASGGRGNLEYSIDSSSWQSSGNFINLAAGNYIVIVRDSAQCLNTSDTLLIIQPPEIIADITVVHSMNGEPGSIHVSASGGTGNLQYSVNGISGPFVPDTAFADLWPADYQVVVRDENGCTYEDTVTLEAIPPLEIDVSYSHIACYGDSTGTITLISLNGTGVVLYSIDDSATFQTNGKYTNLPAATYIIYVTDEDHRIFKDTIVLTEPLPITVNATLIPNSCSGVSTDGSISLAVSGGTPDYTYLWSNDSTTKDLSGLDEGSYTVTITDFAGCVYKEIYDITSTVSVTADAGSDTAVCPLEDVILNGSGGSIYLWQPDKGLSNPNIPNPIVRIDTTTTYSLTVTEPGGCFDRDSVTVTIYPLLGINAGNDTIVATGQTIQLNASGGPFDNYYWIPETGLDDPYNPTPSLTVSEEITFHVTGTSSYGCNEMDSVCITIAGNIKIYTGFTPNGDGINDYWEIDNVIYFPNIVVEVFNRWGEKVFHSEGYTSEKRWDGKYKGKDLAVGTYYYIINLNDGSKPLTGPVTIIR